MEDLCHINIETADGIVIYVRGYRKDNDVELMFPHDGGRRQDIVVALGLDIEFAKNECRRSLGLPSVPTQDWFYGVRVPV